MTETPSRVIDQYLTVRDTYLKCADKLRILLEDLLRHEVALHSISTRAKTPQSLEGKLVRGQGKYAQLSDVTDLVGARVITYMHDDVDRAAAVITREFDIDAANSVDKRRLHDPDRFGYLSLHFVASLDEARRSLPEYSPYAGLVFEIQIRSILQHAWAEIEHDLGYKSAAAIPRDLRRRFSRLAGLLEVADEEFAAIRDRLDAYGQQLEQELSGGSLAIPLDQQSMTAFIEKNGAVQRLDQRIASDQEARLGTLDPGYAGRLSDLLGRLVSNLQDLEARVLQHEQTIFLFAKEWLQQTREVLPRGISLFYLGYVLLGAAGSILDVEKYLHEARVGPKNDRADLARQIVQVYALCSPTDRKG